MREILEGLRRGDLEDLVLPMVSIDEFESRIDDSAIVVGLYVGEKDAAQDLNRFIQRSPVELLDTEISPAPDSKGYYMVFVELLNTEKFGENVENILEEIASLTKISTWKMKIRGHDDLMPFDRADLSKFVASQRADPVKEAALSFLSASDLADARFATNDLILEYASRHHTYAFIGFGDADRVIRDLRLDESAENLSLSSVSTGRSLELALGSGWTVHRVGDLSLLSHVGSDAILALRDD